MNNENNIIAISENDSVIPKVKNLSDLYRQNPGVITCNHCDYLFIPQNEHYFTCITCNVSYIVCQRCKKLIVKQ